MEVNERSTTVGSCVTDVDSWQPSYLLPAVGAIILSLSLLDSSLQYILDPNF
jgi:hypothetical protein